MKALFGTLVALLLATSLAAQDVELRDDHPDEYVVQEGDTLWDIAGRFLTRPWQWPAIWQANPQIDNPHLIYPGDRLSLIYIDGQPRLVSDRVRRMSPEVRREPITGPITAIPLSAVEPFLVRPRVVARDDLAGLPYVVANEDTRVISAEPYRAFVRGLDEDAVGSEVVIARLAHQFEEVKVDGRNAVRQNLMRGNMGAVPSEQRPIHIDRTLNPFTPKGKIIGYQLWEVARAEVLATGDPAQLEVVNAELEVRPGDYILPVDPHLYDLTFFPRPPEFDVPAGASVIGIHVGDTAVGHYQIVAIDLGQADGVEPGNVFSTFVANEKVRDEFIRGLRGRPAPSNVSGGRVQLPPQYNGQVMVFRAFERVSYALVMSGNRGVRVGDFIFHPDKRL